MRTGEAELSSKKSAHAFAEPDANLTRAGFFRLDSILLNGYAGTLIKKSFRDGALQRDHVFRSASRATEINL